MAPPRAAHVLIGGLAVGYHGRLRATVDVDLLVPRKKLGPIAKALEARGYVVRRFDDMIRVYEAGADAASEAVADLVAREANPVHREAAKVAEPAVVLGHAVQIVARGALVALKYNAALSRTRRIEDRYQDVADIGRVVAKHFEPADEAMAVRIAEHIHPGGGAGMAELLDDLRHGRPVKI